MEEQVQARPSGKPWTEDQQDALWSECDRLELAGRSVTCGWPT
jgi:hypothetical protein